jgi:hypothetical protein
MNFADGKSLADIVLLMCVKNINTKIIKDQRRFHIVNTSQSTDSMGNPQISWENPGKLPFARSRREA